jgi:hypothetical protein
VATRCQVDRQDFDVPIIHVLPEVDDVATEYMYVDETALQVRLLAVGIARVWSKRNFTNP